MKNDDKIFVEEQITDDLNSLCHYGVPGQKRGQHDESRRYQNHAVYARGKPRYARGNSKSEDHIPLYSYDKLVPLKSMKGVENMISSSPVDKDTGLHKKVKVCSTDEDISRINPGFNSSDEGYKNNCVYCSIAYDMRKRGYEVTANKAPYSGVFSRDLERMYPDLLDNIENNFTEYGRILKNTSFNKEKDTVFYKKLNRDLISQGDGARGVLFCTFKSGWGGHAVAYEINGGKVNVNDCQNGERYKSFDKFTPHYSEIMSIRLDNLTFDPSAIKEAVH